MERRSHHGYHPLDSEIMTKSELRILAYGRNGGRFADDLVAFRVFPEQKVVVYSGLTSTGLSTINGTDEILKSLKEEDPSIDEFKFRFFDIQTFRGYDYMNRGKVQITEIKFKRNGVESFFTGLKASELPEAFRPILDILSNP